MEKFAQKDETCFWQEIKTKKKVAKNMKHY